MGRTTVFANAEVFTDRVRLAIASSPTLARVSAYLETTGVEWTDWEDRPAPTHPGLR